MANALAQSLARVRTSANRLNQLTDDAARTVREVEDLLRECSVGIEAWVVVDQPPQVSEEFKSLGYSRWGQQFRIVVAHGREDDPTDATVKPWSDWDRATKLESIEKLPELIEAIVKEVDSRISRVEATIFATHQA